METDNLNEHLKHILNFNIKVHPLHLIKLYQALWEKGSSEAQFSSQGRNVIQDKNVLKGIFSKM